MTERYLDVLTVHLRGYTGKTWPGNLAEEMVLQIDVGARVDVEQLADEVEDDVGSGPRRVHQSMTETSWGASGSGAELIVDIPAVLTGLASLPVLWDAISRRMLYRGQARVLDPQNQAESARAWLAQSLNVGTDAIKVIGFEPVGDSRGVTRMRRR